MIKKLFLIVFEVHLMLSKFAAATNHTGYLEEAVEHLVDYTAAESRNIVNSLDIKKRLISIAQEEFDAKIGS